MIDQLKQAIEAGELTVDQLVPLLGDGYVVRTKEDHEAFLTNYAQDVKKPRAAKTDVNKVVQETLGIAFEEGEDLKTYFERVTKPVQSNEEYEQKFKLQESNLQRLKKDLEAKENEVAKLKTDFLVKDFEGEFNKLFGSAKIVGVDDDNIKQKELSLLKMAFLNQYDLEPSDKGLVVKTKAGEYIRNPQTYEPQSAYEVLKSEYGYKIASEATAPSGTNGAGKPTVTVRQSLSKSDVYASAAEKGLALGSPEWRNYVSENLASIEPA